MAAHGASGRPRPDLDGSAPAARGANQALGRLPVWRGPRTRRRRRHGEPADRSVPGEAGRQQLTGRRAGVLAPRHLDDAAAVDGEVEGASDAWIVERGPPDVK